MAIKSFIYDKNQVFNYAKEWAYKRNPKYYDFSFLGGDCTNFCSQCIFAGAPQMNYLKTFGWYYINLNNRSPSFTGVEYLYNFLVSNEGVGPYGEPCSLSEVDVGDVVQLGTLNGDFYHSPIVTEVYNNNVFVSAHSFDAFNRNLASYSYQTIRCVHILGYRKEE